MYVYSDENDACVTAVEAGITKVITATYPVMLAVLSSSCNEKTRTYSEGRAWPTNFEKLCFQDSQKLLAGGGVVRGNCTTRNRRGTCPGVVVRGGVVRGGLVRGVDV